MAKCPDQIISPDYLDQYVSLPWIQEAARYVKEYFLQGSFYLSEGPLDDEKVYHVKNALGQSIFSQLENCGKPAEIPYFLNSTDAIASAMQTYQPDPNLTIETFNGFVLSLEQVQKGLAAIFMTTLQTPFDCTETFGSVPNGTVNADPTSDNHSKWIGIVLAFAVFVAVVLLGAGCYALNKNYKRSDSRAPNTQDIPLPLSTPSAERPEESDEEEKKADEKADKNDTIKMPLLQTATATSSQTSLLLEPPN